MLRRNIFNRLKRELEYCPQIEEIKISEMIDSFPERIIISNDLVKTLTEYNGDFYLGRFRMERTQLDDELKNVDEYEYEKKQAELIGDEVEKRLRRVLSEFFEKRD